MKRQYVRLACCLWILLGAMTASARAQFPNDPCTVDPIQTQEAQEVLHGKPADIPFPNPHPDAQWFPRAGLGLFLHWGIYSVAGAEATLSMLKGWYEPNLYPPERYYRLAKSFNPLEYDPDKWMAAAEKAGFSYAVLTTRHGDGYALWPSKYGNLNTGQYMGGRDLLRPYVEACRKHGLKVGFYFAPADVHFPNYPLGNADWDAKKKAPPIKAEDMEQHRKNFEHFYAYILGQLRELLTRYGKIDLLWLDGGGWRGLNDTGGKQLYAWIRQLQPGIVINDRWPGTPSDFTTPEGKLPTTRPEGWWDNSASITGGQWSYNSASKVWPPADVMAWLVKDLSWGGNFLADVGPRPDGTMQPDFYVLCSELAQWMAHSRDSLIGADSSPGDDYSNVPITRRGLVWYLHVLPTHTEPIEVRNVPDPRAVMLLRTGRILQYRRHDDKLVIERPSSLRTAINDVIALHWKNDPLVPNIRR